MKCLCPFSAGLFSAKKRYFTNSFIVTLLEVTEKEGYICIVETFSGPSTAERRGGGFELQKEHSYKKGGGARNQKIGILLYLCYL